MKPIKSIKPTVLAIVLSAVCLPAAAQTVSADTIQGQADTTQIEELQEVVIKAPKVVRKSDMDLYFPSSSAVEHSKNGMTLLRNMMIPSLEVNEVMGTVTSAGQSVQVRINGREATVKQVKALLPQSIKRVEWITEPGLRYNGAYAVLNFIVRNPDAGGSFMADAMPALTAKWGQHNANVKLNYGRSQWEVGGEYKLTSDLDIYRDYMERFTYADGTSLTRNEKTQGGSLDNNFADANLTYSYIKPDTTTIYVGFSINRDMGTGNEYNGLMSMSDGRPDILLRDVTNSRGTSPAFGAYLEQKFPRRQSLVVDLNASWDMGRTYNSYVERDAASGDLLTDVSTDIYDRNQGYAMEADYIKRWDNGRLTAGASYKYSRSRSQYDNLDGEIFHQRQDKAYFFAEYYHRINKVSLTAGMGANFTSFKFAETGQGNSSWNMRPEFSASYAINNKHQLRLNFTSWQTAPTLMQTNIAAQQLDGFQWRIGNQDLKTSSSYMLSLRYNFTLPRIIGSFGINGFTSPNAIAPYMYWDGDRLVTSYENSRGFQQLLLRFSPQVEVIPEWFMVNGSITYSAERMRGNGYTHYNHNWSGSVSAMLSHWGFTLTTMYQRSSKDLFGETISWGENLSVVMLSYDWKNWSFGGGVIMPFGRYDQGAKQISRYNTNEKHNRMDMRMPYLRISYNIQWGRQKQGVNKLINAGADTQRSTAGGR